MKSSKPRNLEMRLLIMRYIISFATEMGKQPSVREIGEAAGLRSTSTTAGYLRRMVNEGLLEQAERSNRSYSVTRYAADMLRNAG